MNHTTVGWNHWRKELQTYLEFVGSLFFNHHWKKVGVYTLIITVYSVHCTLYTIQCTVIYTSSHRYSASSVYIVHIRCTVSVNHIVCTLYTFAALYRWIIVFVHCTHSLHCIDDSSSLSPHSVRHTPYSETLFSRENIDARKQKLCQSLSFAGTKNSIRLEI